MNIKPVNIYYKVPDSRLGTQVFDIGKFWTQTKIAVIYKNVMLGINSLDDWVNFAAVYETGEFVTGDGKIIPYCDFYSFMEQFVLTYERRDNLNSFRPTGGE